jgi:hypothetical protein
MQTQLPSPIYSMEMPSQNVYIQQHLLTRNIFRKKMLHILFIGLKTVIVRTKELMFSSKQHFYNQWSDKYGYM